MRKIKERWGVESNWRLVVIMVVFSVAGSSILYVRAPVYRFLHLPPETSLWIKIPLTLLMYQVLLLAWGAVFGEFRFFWEKEKKLGRWLAKPFRRT